MKRMLALLLLLCMCCSLSACDRMRMWRNQMTDPPTAPSTLPHATVNNTVEEISPGEVNIKGCVIDISHVVYTYAGEDGDQKACAIHVSVMNKSGKKIKLDSLCQIRVKQDGKICMAVNAPDSIGFDQDGYVEPSKFGVYTKYYKITSFNKPVQVQLLYHGEVLTEFTYKGYAG